MKYFQFNIVSKDAKSKAKCGEIHTKHGKIQTPAFVPVATSASLKSLTPEEIKKCHIDTFFVNTYHMIFRPGLEVIQKAKGLHNFMNWKGPIMTDSAGFQAFSLGEAGPRNTKQKQQNLVKISNKGIYFKSAWDGQKKFLGPVESIKAQQILDSDIMMAFDECTFYPITEKRAKAAMERTHLWAKESLAQKKKKTTQALYGIVQGSVFEFLRKESASFLTNLDFEGFAIGSVANSKEPREKVFAVLDWTLPILLPEEKPVHFLGIGEIEDIFLSVKKGIDSFDCVTPTRLARMGWIFNKKCGVKNKFRYDITKANFSKDQNKLEKNCHCYTCQNYKRSYIHHLFRTRELLAYRLATIHNLYFFGFLMKNIRESIAENTYLKLKKSWLK